MNTATERVLTLSPNEAAALLGVAPGTLANWRHRGGGPRFVKVGSRVRYRACDVEEWLDGQTRTSTSSPVLSGRS